jgi:hypothetical protein
LIAGCVSPPPWAPYRTPPPRTPPPPRPPPPFEEVFLAWATLALGGLRVALALVGHEPFTAEPTVALGLMLLGGVALVRTERSRRGSPKAAPRRSREARNGRSTVDGGGP